MSDFVVKTENLNVWYGKQTIFGRAGRVHILHDVSFELRRGEVLGSWVNPDAAKAHWPAPFSA